jgi:hypothetical protein
MNIIHEIFRFDYMGSAEFEWGAVPQALRFLAKQAVKQNLINGLVHVSKNRVVYYICPLEYETGVVERIKFLSKEQYAGNLKEHCGLCEKLDPQYKYSQDLAGWLELDNGFMFFIDKVMYEKTCKLFGIK